MTLSWALASINFIIINFCKCFNWLQPVTGTGKVEEGVALDYRERWGSEECGVEPHRGENVLSFSRHQ